MQAKRHYSVIDQFCIEIDQMLRAMTNNVVTTGAPYPAKAIEEQTLNEQQRKHSAGLMRVNHAGEICAQALYHGQGLVSKKAAIREKMQLAAIQEGDHLAWCKKRLDELDSHTSYLKPFWYTGSFCMGALAGIAGDKWSLGFVAETEHQVSQHLERHLKLLPQKDQRSYKILEKMEADEAKHKDEAISLGARELPRIIKFAMTCCSKIMVKIAYWV